MQRVLVLEQNQKTAERLVTALKQIEDLSVSLVPTMREACLIVAETPQDMAFIPLTESEQLSHALRAFQPDLKLVLTTSDSQLLLSNNYRQDFQGLLHIDQLESELLDILGEIDLDSPAIDPLPPGSSRLREACQEIGLDGSTAVKLVVLSLAGRLIGYCGQGLKSQVEAVVELLNEAWPKDKISGRLQFLEMPDYYDARLVYSCQVSGVLLSLVVAPDTPVGDVRQTADQLVYLLSRVRKKKVEERADPNRRNGRVNESGSHSKSGNSFVIAWRPVKPLPLILQNVVWDCLSSLSAENDCKLEYLSVKSDIVHLVLQCRPGKTAAWAAFVLKSGINNEIQRQFGVKSSIWRKGFYASESSQPLKEAELKMLLTK